VCAAALLFASVASGASILTSYNAIISGNFNDACCDTGGGLAIGGNVTLPNSDWQIADDMIGETASNFPNSTTLVIGGTLAGGPGQLYNGNYYAPNVTVVKSGNTAGTIVNEGTGTSDGSNPPFSFTTQFTSFQSTSTTIGGDTANKDDTAPFINGSGQLQIDINDSGLNVVDITGAQAAAGNIDFVLAKGLSFATTGTASGNTWVLVNISDALSGGKDTGGATLNENSGVEVYENGQTTVNAVNYGNSDFPAEDILYNFYQATGTVTLEGSIVGSVLAPSAGVTDTSGQQIDGSLIATSFGGATVGSAGDAEFHNLIFLGPTFTPEPAPFAIVGLGLIGLAYIRKRRRA
jgi:choice-of-anchor A domain-containing protein